MKSLVKKWFFSENASIHDRALVPPILPFLLAFIAGLLGNVAKFFIAPYLACAITLILAIFFLHRSTKKQLKQQDSNTVTAVFIRARITTVAGFIILNSL